jgi:hypothetical protein
MESKNFNDTVRFLVEHYKCRPDRVYFARSHFILYGRIKASSIINYVQMLSLTL